jgi:hypothetical protein
MCLTFMRFMQRRLTSLAAELDFRLVKTHDAFYVALVRALTQ